MNTESSEVRQSQLKVLSIGPLPPPIGGMATVLQNLDPALTQVFDHRVLNTAKTTSEGRSLALGVAAQLALLWRYIKLLLLWRPAIVHIHTCSFFTFWRSVLDMVLARLAGRRVVLHIHGAMFHKFLNGLGPVRARLARLGLGLCHAVIVLGDDWKEIISEWTDARRIHVVVNTVPVPPEATPREGEPPVVLVMANYERRKGQGDLIQAVARLGKTHGAGAIRLRLFGAEFEPGEREYLQAMVDELQLGEFVEIPGPAFGDAKQRAFEQADIFCLPSYDEGLPMAMLEAMAIGLPVLVTRVGAIPEVIRDRENGLLVDAGDVGAMVDALALLIDERARSEAIAECGRQTVIDAYSMQVSVQRLGSVYRSVL